MDIETRQLINPHSRGAEDGCLFGLLFTAMFFGTVFAQNVPLLGIAANALLFAVPVILFMRMRSTWAADMGRTSFASMWTQGVLTILCGSLISAAVAFCYLRWLDPEWISRLVTSTAQTLREMPQGAELADFMDNAVKHNAVPTAMQMVMQVFCTMVFTGSMLSLLLAAIVRSMRPAKKQQ